MNTTLAALCDDCPPRFYCVDSAIWPLDCPPGKVCAGITGYNYTLCPQVNEPLTAFIPKITYSYWELSHHGFASPQGTYGPGVGLADESECTQCDGGYYCDSMGMDSVGPECYAGYYCREGVNTPAPSENNTGDGRKILVYHDTDTCVCL